MPAESDARYGSFDFRAAHAAAPVDLQELLDQHESLPFRRRGYERDGMLKGIEQAAAFILFLSVDVLKRPYCQMEIRHALALKKPVVLIHGECETSRTAHGRRTKAAREP